jgi:hypothetical protein
LFWKGVDADGKSGSAAGTYKITKPAPEAIVAEESQIIGEPITKD